MPTVAQIQARMDQLKKEGDLVKAKLDECRSSGEWPDPDLVQRQGKITIELLNLDIKLAEILSK